MPATLVVDTSVWVSALLNPHGYPARIYQAARDGTVAVVTSIPLIDELAEVLLRPRIARLRRLSADDIRSFVSGIAELATFVQVTGALAACRDPDDDIVLETAIVGQATHVISRDEDLTRDPDLQQQLVSHGIQLVTVNQFLKALTGS